MKIVVTGSLGHISKPLTEELVQKGHQVTVISSKPEKQAAIEALGASAAIGTIDDADFLTAAFTGADAVYTMLPPPDFFNPDFDLMAHCRLQANNYAQAIQHAGVKRIVHLSSIGAHMEKNSGIIIFHHTVEGILNGLTDVNITFMRPVAFYYNLYSFLPGIKSMGAIASNYGAEDRIPWVAPADIAAAIADELETAPTHRKIRYVASDEPTCNEIARTLGEAIGMPDLKWVVIGDEELQSAMQGFGMPATIAAGLVEMNASMHNGLLMEDYLRNRPAVMGKIKIADFAKEFAAAYQHQS